MTNPVLEPDLQDSATGQGRWMTIIFNNETNSMDEVIDILMHATGCDAEEAYIEMWEAHHYGKAPVHFAPHQECLEVAEIISTIGIKTIVQKEWAD